VTEILPHLPNKPLVEAILEIRWKLDAQTDPGYPLYVGALASAVADVYPFQQRLPAAEVPDEFSLHLVKFRLRTAEEAWPLIQAGPGIVTLNSVSDYSWERFREGALHLWRSLETAYPQFNNAQFPEVNRVVLKYINADKIAALAPLEFMSTLLHTQVSFPEGVTCHETTGSPINAAVHATFPLNRSDTTGIVRIQRGEQNNVPVVVWELIADGKFTNSIGLNDFSVWLDYSHGILENWFFSLINGELLDRYRRGEDGREQGSESADRPAARAK
jgi:uncharacterized protein (TIGR04255 family)